MGNQNKEVRHLRAQVEALKAQLKVSGSQNTVAIRAIGHGYSTETRALKNDSRKENVYSLDSKYLISDLKKTFALTALAILVLFSTYFSEPYWKNWDRYLTEISKNVLSLIKKPVVGSVK